MYYPCGNRFVFLVLADPHPTPRWWRGRSPPPRRTKHNKHNKCHFTAEDAPISKSWRKQTSFRIKFYIESGRVIILTLNISPSPSGQWLVQTSAQTDGPSNGCQSSNCKTCQPCFLGIKLQFWMCILSITDEGRVPEDPILSRNLVLSRFTPFLKGFHRAFNESHPAFIELSTKAILLS